MSYSLRSIVFFLAVLSSSDYLGAEENCFSGEGTCSTLKTMIQKTLNETPETKSTADEADIITALAKRGFDCLFI